MKKKIYVKSNRVFGYTAKKEPQMFQEPLQKSLLTEKDIEEIEHKLKYAFPKPYKDFFISDDFSALEAGFLKIAEIEGYHIYLDLVTGKVVRLYHEELWEMSVVEGVDGSDKEEIRDYILDNELCPDFYDFLKVVCTHEINGELGPNY